jgi:predicted amidophosphoribosyltransferase
MAELVAAWAGDAVVTWAPTTTSRRRARGFDQAELLARGVASELRRPCRGLLSRRSGPAQTGRAGEERRRGVAFEALEPVPATVIVVDDVLTTGATLTAAAAALRSASSISVIAATAGRTPLKVTNGWADA